LHRCRHKFCFKCIKYYCYRAFYDTSYLPISCPIYACRCKLVISDVLRIIDKPAHQKKLLSIVLNKYIQDNNQCYVNCLTPTCPQIFEAQTNIIACDLCLGKFCLKCRQISHEGMTCKKALKSFKQDEISKSY